MRPTDIHQLLNKYDLKAKKHLGQNFLCDPNYINKIIEASTLDQSVGVIEIGPGLGSLTRELVNKAGYVLAYEIDQEMASILNDTIKAPNLKIINEDFLKAKVIEDIYLYFKDFEKIIVVANLPYYITTPILIKILEERLPLTKMIVMMQKEVAERLSGVPKTKDYNALSVLVQYYTKVKTLFDVQPDAFIPKPEVKSTVLELTIKTEINPKPLNEEFFLKFNRMIFSQRRKTLINNLSGLKLEKTVLIQTMKEAGFSENIRAEALSVYDIIKLSDRFYQLTKDA